MYPEEFCCSPIRSRGHKMKTQNHTPQHHNSTNCNILLQCYPPRRPDQQSGRSSKHPSKACDPCPADLMEGVFDATRTDHIPHTTGGLLMRRLREGFKLARAESKGEQMAPRPKSPEPARACQRQCLTTLGFGDRREHGCGSGTAVDRSTIRNRCSQVPGTWPTVNWRGCWVPVFILLPLPFTLPLSELRFARMFFQILGHPRGCPRAQIGAWGANGP